MAVSTKTIVILAVIAILAVLLATTAIVLSIPKTIPVAPIPSTGMGIVTVTVVP